MERSEGDFQNGRQQNMMQVDQVNGSWSDEGFLPQGRVCRENVRWSAGSWTCTVQLSPLAVPPRYPPTQHGKEGGHETQIIFVGVTSDEHERATKRPLEEERGREQREGDGSRAQRLSTELLSVCTAELLLLAHLLHHLDHPSRPHRRPVSTQSPSHLLSFYLPVVPFNNPGACWYAEQRWSV